MAHTVLKAPQVCQATEKSRSIQSRFDKMKSDHAKRIKTSEEFEDRIKKQQAILNEVIVSATDEM